MLSFALQVLTIGFQAALEPINVALILMGVIGGMIFALLPGLNLVMVIILLVPVTYGMGAIHAISLLIGAYVGGVYGGAISAILYNIPGDSIHVPMLEDGYELTKKGKSGEAIGWTLGAFTVGGLAAALVMFFFSGPLANYSLRLSSPEYFTVIVFALASVVVVGTTHEAPLSSSFIGMGIGLLLATVGIDPIYSESRFSFGIPFLIGGIGVLPVMIGLYAIGEILSRIWRPGTHVVPAKSSGRLLSWIGPRQFLRRRGPLIRGTVVGAVVGIMPGAGATPAAFVAYGMERNYGRNRKLLGTGCPDGLIAPQAAASASVGGALIPLFTLGIPGSVADAVILGALQLQGIYPSPVVFVKEQALIYPIFASVFIGIFLTILVTMVFIRAMLAVLQIPPPLLSTFIMLLAMIGAYTLRSNIADMWVAIVVGIATFGLRAAKIPIGPLLLGVILGPLAEGNLIEALSMSHGDWTVFVSRPISAVFVVLTIFVFVVYFWSRHRAKAS